MTEAIEDRRDRDRLAAVETFLGALSAGAKTVQLYKPGHSVIGQVAERVLKTLQAALGQEQGITLDVKAKSVLVGETALAETPEIVSFAVSMHMLGVGQILFTNRISNEGLIEFFRLLTLKPDERKTLSDLQKEIQLARIEGLQMTFILSFVVTEALEDQPPGKLTQEQVAAFCAARNLPDLLTLLYRQNEGLRGKEAEGVTDLLDEVLHREMALEDFERAMPWDHYDARLRARFGELAAQVLWEPGKKGAARRRWTREAVTGSVAVFEKADMEFLAAREEHGHGPAVLFSLEKVHALLDGGPAEKTAKHSVYAYVRLLAELGRGGDLSRLFAESARWKRMEADERAKPLLKLLQETARARVPTPAFASRLAERVGTAGDDAGAAVEFVLFFGDVLYGLLVDELRRVVDKAARAKVCALLAGCARRAGAKPLIEALKDDDWLLVSTVVAVLRDVGVQEDVHPLKPLLKHAHRRVREETVRALSKLGGTAAAEALAAFARGSHGEEEERCRAVIALSLLAAPGLDKRLIAVFEAATDAALQVAAVRGLARAPTTQSLLFLKAAARRTWFEILTRRRADVRRAARESLAQLKKEGHA